MVSEEKSLNRLSMRSFDDSLLEIIDDVLKNIFGEKSVKNLIQIMKEEYSLKWEEIPQKPQVFADALQKILGTGSIIIEDLIIETLYSNLGLELKRQKGYKFSDYVEKIRPFELFSHAKS